ncbi:hypothetical protein LAZ67_3002591 [Cordylochernes scorpioides]|uniref:Reverse transcriptase Ty1/copia-type domain-containing protein n=1 Tax=Cordylochernes scorpioides TaxID=51811 RepID=A0ABY6KB50_9ARAC|nr:hypothetical protein LAZ67_3002591 [Cordylochernes scorpioides]
MESDPDSESGENTTFPKKETTLGRTQEVPPNHEDVTPPPPVSDVLGRLTTTLHQLSAVTGLARNVELPRYNGSYEAQSFFTNYDAQADRAQLQYSTRLRKPPNLLQAPLRVTNTRAMDNATIDNIRRLLELYQERYCNQEKDEHFSAYKDVLHVPDLNENILSVSKMVEDDKRIIFNIQGNYIIDEQDEEPIFDNDDKYHTYELDEEAFKISHGDLPPSSYEEAIRNPDSTLWRQAMNKDIHSFKEHHVWNLIELPQGAKPIKSKWVFSKKIDP